MGDLRKRLVELAASVARGNYDPTEPPPGRWSRVQKWRDHDAAVERLKRLGLAIKDIADGEAKATTDALRSIATIVGCPANTDPLTDLDGLVSMVRGLAERAETVRVVTADRDALAAEVDARIADAVAADRAAVCAWVREWDPRLGQIASHIEDGRHINDDAPPLPSLRMVMLLRDELLRQVETLTAERDRRIDPVEHARAMVQAYRSGFDGRGWLAIWRIEPERAALLARVGADVLAEVER